MGPFKYSIARFSLAQLVAIPLTILVISLAILFYNIMIMGSPITPGIDFAGGVGVTIPGNYQETSVREYFSRYSPVSLEEGIGGGWYLKFGPMNGEEFQEFAEYTGRGFPDAKIDYVGATFAQTLQAQASVALLFSFAGMAVVVFAAFRSFVPAGAVVFCAFADIAMTAAAMHLSGIPLSLGTTAALLMLIGYSVDSDILMTNRILKRKGKLDEKFEGAFRTGLIMTTTTMAAIIAMLAVSLLGQIEIIAQISSVLLIGLVFDIMNTWLTNAGLLRWYAIRRGER